MEHFNILITKANGTTSSFTTDDKILCAVIEANADAGLNLGEVLLAFAKVGIDSCDYSPVEAVDRCGGVSFKYIEQP